jgi:hypothetical protein
MDEEAVLWVRHDPRGAEQRCTFALIGEGEFELRLWEGVRLLWSEDLDTEAQLLERAAYLATHAAETIE